ncbi:transcription elongation factor B polypeptide 2 [Paramuricea clavata]|uniref:Elongin-B n=1 Tax=Paramuricea clavata TaxID=317549 RepID=A0A6S7HC03_PARCT|nr:transcription elongation factor B polypeptide 2 [Paramuricea clavata]
MEIFVMVRRAKLTMFLDCTESTTVSELKKMIEGIAKKAPEDQKLFKDEQSLDDNKTLGDYGFTSQTARPQSPAMIGLACKVEGTDDWEPLNITNLSTPPDPPDVMIPQESSAPEAK